MSNKYYLFAPNIQSTPAPPPPGPAGDGFFFGGGFPNYNKLNFATETVSTPGTSEVTTGAGSGFSSMSNGFGYFGAVRSTSPVELAVYKYEFSTGTITDIGFGPTKDYGTAEAGFHLNNSTKAFHISGSTLTDIKKYDNVTDTWSTIGSVAYALSRGNSGSFAGKGYTRGGSDGAVGYSNINSFDFTTEIHTVDGASASAQHDLEFASVNDTSGLIFSAGGRFSPGSLTYFHSIEKFNTVADTVTTSSAVLGANIKGLGGVNSDTKGYFFSGTTNPSDALYTSIERLDLVTETETVITATPAPARSNMSYMQSGGWL